MLLALGLTDEIALPFMPATCRIRGALSAHRLNAANMAPTPIRQARCVTVVDSVCDGGLRCSGTSVNGSSLTVNRDFRFPCEPEP